MKFSDGFYWGAATASYQVEGGIENCDWAKAAREGRVPPCGKACDHYNRFEEDFDIAKSLGHNAHRFSIEWARIEPEEGKFDEKEIEHYRKVLHALHARKIKPYITLWHFTLPVWFSESGGFERDDSPEVFARYARYVAEKLGGECDGISTMNEPNVYASLGWLKGAWPPFKRFGFTSVFKPSYSGEGAHSRYEESFFSLFTYLRVARNLAKAHNHAHDAVKEVAPNLEVSVVKHVVFFEANWNPFNKLRAMIANYLWTKVFMNRTYRKCDSIGLNYYHRKKFGNRETHRKTDMGWDFYPQGIYGALMLLSRYQKPLFVSEAGIADEDDDQRAEYITEQIKAVWKAIQDGADVHGHMYWSLLDNYEWAFGFTKRFGLVEIDYETLERKIRPSAYVYKKIIDANAVVE